MSDTKNLVTPREVVYRYDGGLEGFFTCVFESVYRHELPAAIVTGEEEQLSLMPERWVVSDREKAARVRASIPKRISPRALELLEIIFLSCMQDKELALLRFLLLGYREGARVMSMLGHADVAPLLKAEGHFMGERHLLLGFIRFTEYDGMLAATITPKNFVLPFLIEHFTARFSGEDFLIYDKAHKAALLYQNRRPRIFPVEEMEFPEVSEREERYRALWKRFYNTIAIEGRENAKCRMTHCPKRYWENMTEMWELL